MSPERVVTLTMEIWVTDHCSFSAADFCTFGIAEYDYFHGFYFIFWVEKFISSVTSFLYKLLSLHFSHFSLLGDAVAQTAQGGNGVTVPRGVLELCSTEGQWAWWVWVGAGLGDLSHLFQHYWFCDSVILWRDVLLLVAFSTVYLKGLTLRLGLIEVAASRGHNRHICLYIIATVNIYSPFSGLLLCSKSC